MASTRPKEIRSLLRIPGYPIFSQGVRCAIIATLAFGAMDVGIGASATLSGWFLPVLWTRIFSICSLILISYWKRRKRMKRFQRAITAKLSTEAPAHPAPSIIDSQAISSPSPFGNPDGRSAVDAETTVITRPFHKLSQLRAAIDPDATIIIRPSRHHNISSSMNNSSSAPRHLEAGLENTVPLRPFRSVRTMFTLAGGDEYQRAAPHRAESS
jgi:hypothetical protein